MSAADIPLIILTGGAAGTGKTSLAKNTKNEICTFIYASKTGGVISKSDNTKAKYCRNKAGTGVG